MSIAALSRIEHELEPDEISERGSAIYEERLKDQLEPGLAGKYVAIHVETGDYEVADWSGDASRALLKRHPKGLLFVRVVGPPTENEIRMAARLIAAEQQGR